MNNQMSDIVVFGARTGTGLELVKIARNAERNVTAVIRPGRNPDELRALGASVVYADALNPDEVENAVGAVAPNWIAVSTLGGHDHVDHKGNTTVVDVALKKVARHMLLVSSLGCGNSREFASQRLLDAIGPTLEEKTKAEDYLCASTLSYTIVRPGGLTSTAPTGRGALYESPAVHGRISRVDLAELLWRSLGNPWCQGKILSAIDKDLLQAPVGTEAFL